MVYPNVLETLDPEGMSVMEIQVTRLEDYARKGKKKKHRHLKENVAAAKGTYGARHDNENDELLDTSA